MMGAWNVQAQAQMQAQQMMQMQQMQATMQAHMQAQQQNHAQHEPTQAAGAGPIKINWEGVRDDGVGGAGVPKLAWKMPATQGKGNPGKGIPQPLAMRKAALVTSAPWEAQLWGEKRQKTTWEGGWQKGGGGAPRQQLPEDYVVDENARFVGKVSAFGKFHGFGTIAPNDEGLVPGNQVFVHWSGLKSADRAPFLLPEMEVEFSLEKMEDKKGGHSLRAKDVSMPGGGVIGLQDGLDATKTFVGGRDTRYTGKLKFYDPKKRFGFVIIDASCAISPDEKVPKELKIWESEVNCGGKSPPKMQNMDVEFGVWKNDWGSCYAHNMTMPGGAPIEAAASNSQERVIVGEGPFTGTVTSFNAKHGWGMIKPEFAEALPQAALEKMAEMKLAAEANGKVAGENLFVGKQDFEAGCSPTEGMEVTFKVYTDAKGVGACNVAAL